MYPLEIPRKQSPAALAQTVNSETGREKQVLLLQNYMTEMTMERSCDFCSTSRLIITGTIVPQKDIFKLTYRSPDGRRVNQIDYILVNGKMRTILDARVMRGAKVYSDHYLVRTRVSLKLAKSERRKNKR